jgi:2'-5' RNA ligase
MGDRLKERCMMIFPQFENMRVIDGIRQQYDPLAEHVKPHITLVFPFQSDISASELKDHLIDKLGDFHSFSLRMKGITAVQAFGNYLFLNLQEGAEEIIRIHQALYTGLLEPYYPPWLKRGGFYPHMTVGRLAEEEAFRKAAEAVKGVAETFDTLVKKSSVEIIDENKDSILELELPLK